MKRIVIMILFATVVGIALGELTPDSYVLTFVRGGVTSAISSNAYVYVGSTIRLTNCVARIETNSVQDLTGLGVNVTVGNAATALTYAAWIEDTSGVFGADVTLPTLAQLVPSNVVYSTRLAWSEAAPPSRLAWLEVWATNAAGLRYTYPDYRVLPLRVPLED